MGLRSGVLVLWLFAAVLLCSLTENIVYLFIVLLAVLYVGLRFRIRLKVALLSSCLFGIPLFLINLLLVRGGENVIYSVPNKLFLFGADIPIPLVSGDITLDGVYYAFFYLLFLVDMFMAFHIFNKMVSSDELIRSMSFFASSSALLTGLVLRFIPTVQSDSQSVLDAQKSRGLNIKRKGILSRMKYLTSLSIPTIVCSLERSLNIAESIESRGYSRNRTNFFRKPWIVRDKIHAAVLLLAIAVVFYLRFTHALDKPSLDALLNVDIIALACILSLTLVTLK
ncbi:MAG: energy-coupling factor transporter transmembrane protein EcfT [Candidatus Altiarchaeota archaeon]|nr:energy-coupling factor transporter transmembrane protein EcfT [Candidatus Altiarchaeota archaeon]